MCVGTWARHPKVATGFVGGPGCEKRVCRQERQQAGPRVGPTSSALLRNAPADVLKYFGCELGAQTKFERESGNSIVNGAHDPKRLAELLEGFIKKYVQCYSCNNPETVVKVKKENISLKCKVRCWARGHFVEAARDGALLIGPVGIFSSRRPAERCLTWTLA